MISYKLMHTYMLDAGCNPVIIGNFSKSVLNQQFELKWDSRECGETTMFAALEGQVTDGHRFVRDALHSGCSGFLLGRKSIERYSIDIEELARNGICLVVDDVMMAIEYAAKKYRNEHSAFRIGITGSVGKTSTKEWLYTLLKRCYSVIATKKSLNTKIAILASIFSISKETEIFICEMGIDRVGEMDELVDLVLPHMTIITRIGSAHIGNFGSQLVLAEEKAKILSRLSESSNEKTAVPYHENRPTAWFSDQPAFFEVFEQHANGVLFEKFWGTTIWKRNNAVENTGKKEYTTTIIGDPITAKVDTSGHLHSLTMALQIAHSLGCSAVELQEGVSEGVSLVGRGKIIPLSNGILIDDAYNASYDSVVAALLDLSERGRSDYTVAILGSMDELGSYSTGYHKMIIEFIVSSAIRSVIFVGDVWKRFSLDFPHFEYLNSLSEAFSAYSLMTRKRKHVVLVKGSRSHGLDRLIDDILDRQDNLLKMSISRSAVKTYRLENAFSSRELDTSAICTMNTTIWGSETGGAKW